MVKGTGWNARFSSCNELHDMKFSNTFDLERDVGHG